MRRSRKAFPAMGRRGYRALLSSALPLVVGIIPKAPLRAQASYSSMGCRPYVASRHSPCVMLPSTICIDAHTGVKGYEGFKFCQDRR
jgi:hypothetical protein